MTGQNFIDALGLRLEDPASTLFTTSAKVDSINLSQKTVVNMIHNAYLTELQVIDRAQATDGVGVLTITTPGTSYEAGELYGTGGLKGAFGVDSAGAITTVSITEAGSGYAVAPTVVITDGGSSGTSGVITATLSGVFAFSQLSHSPIRNSISAIRAVDEGLYCNMLEPGDLKRLENSYLAGSITNPVAYIYNEMIQVEPTTVDLIDVWYMKSAFNFDEATSAGTVGYLGDECELNPALHELVLDFSESQLWRMDGKSDRAGLAYQNALSTIKILNDRYQTEKPTGIGTRASA